MPEATIDPITTAAYVITRLQTVVSRSMPSKAGVLTVSEMHGGESENVTPDSATFTINIRTKSDKVTARMKEDIFQIIDAEVAASIPPRTNPKPPSPNPVYEQLSHMPHLVNEEDLATDIGDAFARVFDSKFNFSSSTVSASDDFPVLARTNPDLDTADIPHCYWQYGSTDSSRWAAYGGELDNMPSNHSNRFHPQCVLEDPDDPLKMGAKALCAASLSRFMLGGV